MPAKEMNLCAEEIDGYYVDENMKKVWACELDLLQRFIEICEKHKLRYYMAGGSLLGTVRHHGFIPWDDDIDVDMPRTDYERFCKIAPTELSGKYYFQSTYSESGYARPHAQIRNSETTAILKNEQGLPFNQGIFIDIFPLDAPPENGILKKAQSVILFFLMNFLRAGVMVNPKFNDNLFKNIAHYIAAPFLQIVDFHSLFRIYEKLATHYNSENAIQVGEISFDYRDNCIWDAKWFEETVMLPFENIEVACPKAYHEVLTKSFGDYMTPARDPSYHGTIMFDTEVPYVVYLKKLFNIG